MHAQVFFSYMNHSASTVRQQVSQLWEKIIVKRSSSGAALQHKVLRSLMSVVASYGRGTSSSKDEDWAGMEAALMSLELVLRVILTPSTTKVASGSDFEVAPTGNHGPSVSPNRAISTPGPFTTGSFASSTSSSMSTGSNPSFHMLSTPVQGASSAFVQHIGAQSPADHSPKPSPMQGAFVAAMRQSGVHVDLIFLQLELSGLPRRHITSIVLRACCLHLFHETPVMRGAVLRL
jgi:hypothetical protein